MPLSDAERAKRYRDRHREPVPAPEVRGLRADVHAHSQGRCLLLDRMQGEGMAEGAGMSNASAILGVILVTVFFKIDPISAIFVFGLLVIVWNLITGKID